MKKSILYSSVTGLGLVALAFGLYTPSVEEYYQPRENVEQNADSYHGAAEWMYKRRANQVTGLIDEADVLRAKAQVRSMDLKAKKSAQNLQWEEVGPYNIGGRTRALVIDPNNPDIMYAGAVSGGAFKSTNGGRSWTPLFDGQQNMAVVSLALAPNGDLYAGTGEGMYYVASGTGAQGILGDGVYKSTDGGASFTHLTSTTGFSSVGKMAVSPNNSDVIYLATEDGFRISTDGGNVWNNPFTSQADSRDMVVTPSGSVWVVVGSSLYFSADGTEAGFTEISKTQVGGLPTDLPRSSSRMRMVVSPQDENYVYVTSVNGNGSFNKAYRSTDKGATWTVIGSNNTFLNPHGTQGRFAHALGVSPMNKDRIIVGGLDVWEWSLTGGWKAIASRNDGNGTNPFYVHADNHLVTFHPTNPAVIYICNDGGIFKSGDNGLTWKHISRGYNCTQFYTVGIGRDGSVMGGTQDNGTIYIAAGQVVAQNGLRVPGVTYKGSVRDGDGIDAEISKLDGAVAFKGMQYGILGRTDDSGTSFVEFYDFDRMDPTDISQNLTASFADFTTPFTLYENLNDPTSTDFINFSADSGVVSLGFGGNKTKFKGTFQRPQLSANFHQEGLFIDAGNQTVTSDASGNLTGDGTGTFNITTGEFEVEFANPVVVDITAKVALSYDVDAEVKVRSVTNNIPISHKLTSGLASNASVNIQDPVQAAFFVGLRHVQGNANSNSRGGIWMTRGVLSNLKGTPEWWHIGELLGSDVPQTMEVSADGDALFVGTSSGRVFRFSNLNAARDSASADVDRRFDTIVLPNTSTSVIERTVLSTGTSGRTITGIAVHPFDNDKLIITAGNYGNSNYVFYSSNATAVSPTFKSVDGDLPDFPVYAATFNYNGADTEVVLGTEDGVFVTDDVTDFAVKWTHEINGFANVPVFDLVQQRTIRYDLKDSLDFEGSIYAATHGRGIFKTNTTADYVGIAEPTIKDDDNALNVLKVYPNPADNHVTVELNLTAKSDVNIVLRDLNGKMVRSVQYNKLAADVEELTVNVEGLPTGTYLISLTKGNETLTTKLVKK